MEYDKLLSYFSNDDLAANTFLTKYHQEGDITPDDMHRRMAKEFARISFRNRVYNPDGNQNLSKYGEKLWKLGGDMDLKDHEDKIYNLFKDFKYIIPQGSVMAVLGNKFIGSLSNCFVSGQPEDSYGGIIFKDEELIHLMRRRGGVGIDISTLRPSKTLVSGAAKTSTGAVSFMHRYSNTTREVAQDGRRGALMISMDVNHPDIMEFIKIKRDLTQVTGANISIKLNNEFMNAVKNDEDYILRFPCNIEDSKLNEIILDNEIKTESSTWNTKYELDTLYEIEDKVYIKIIKAKEYWDEIIKSAHGVAEPGLMFWDNMVGYSPDGVYDQYRPITTNPCSEIGMQEYDACRLIAVNLFNFVENPFTKDAWFNTEKFYECNYEAMVLSDNLIDLEVEHINRIIEKVESDPQPIEIKGREISMWKKIKKTALSSRRTGLGFTALGDMLAALNLPYGSDESLEKIEEIMKVKMRSELDCTTDLAIQRGPFEGWDKNEEFKHNDDADLEGMNDFYKFICDNFPRQAKRLYYYGRRNVSWSTVAPTGTVSMLAQTTSGIEPLFSPFYKRRKKINPSEVDVKVDFVDDSGDKWREFYVLHPKFKEWMEAKGYNDINNYDNLMLQTLFEQSPWYGSTANDINWIRRVELQSIIQKYITHSISSTINLPKDVKLEEVSEIYEESWKKGLKGITVYRDGSRSGVLVSSDDGGNLMKFNETHAPKRPKTLPCKVIRFNNNYEKWVAFVGLMDNHPYEVFTGRLENIDLSNNIEVGEIKKVKEDGVKRYDFIYDGGVVKNISSISSKSYWNYGKLISGILRHGMPLTSVVDTINNLTWDEEHINTWKAGISRALKKFIKDGNVEGISCDECKSTQIRFEEGCAKCLNCGNSACS